MIEQTSAEVSHDTANNTANNSPYNQSVLFINKNYSKRELLLFIIKNQQKTTKTILTVSKSYKITFLFDFNISLFSVSSGKPQILHSLQFDM